MAKCVNVSGYSRNGKAVKSHTRCGGSGKSKSAFGQIRDSLKTIKEMSSLSNAFSNRKISPSKFDEHSAGLGRKFDKQIKGLPGKTQDKLNTKWFKS